MRVAATLGTVFVFISEDPDDEKGDGVSSPRYCRLVERPRFPTWGNLCSTGNVEWG